MVGLPAPPAAAAEFPLAAVPGSIAPLPGRPIARGAVEPAGGFVFGGNVVFGAEPVVEFIARRRR